MRFKENLINAFTYLYAIEIYLGSISLEKNLNIIHLSCAPVARVADYVNTVDGELFNYEI